MAFKQHQNLQNPVESFIQVAAKAGEAYVPGEVLTVDSTGCVTKCTGTVKPMFICQETKTAAAGDTIAVTMVQPQQILEVPLSASGASLKAGNLVTIETDGLRVTATTASGVFTITEIVGTAIGDVVRGVFK